MPELNPQMAEILALVAEGDEGPPASASTLSAVEARAQSNATFEAFWNADRPTLWAVYNHQVPGRARADPRPPLRSRRRAAGALPGLHPRRRLGDRQPRQPRRRLPPARPGRRLHGRERRLPPGARAQVPGRARGLHRRGALARRQRRAAGASIRRGSRSAATAPAPTWRSRRCSACATPARAPLEAGLLIYGAYLPYTAEIETASQAAFGDGSYVLSQRRHALVLAPLRERPGRQPQPARG